MFIMLGYITNLLNMILIIGLVSTSQEKFDEISKSCSLYGHTVEFVDPDKIDEFLQSSTKERRIKGAIVEKSSLIKPVHPEAKQKLRTQLEPADQFVNLPTKVATFNIHDQSELTDHHLEILWHHSLMTLYVLSPKGVKETYMCSDYTRGYIDKKKYRTIHKKTKIFQDCSIVPRPIYGWDSVFCNHRTGKSTLEYDEDGYKVSPRQNNISKIIQKLFHYSKNIDLHHNPQRYSEVVDYHNKSFDKYVKSVPEFCPELESEINNIIKNICQQAINQGAFFRSSRNRRHNGWCPGLNMGIPFTSKPKDRIHELAYQFHDFSHFNIPDLVFTGETSEFHRFVYIAYRLMSEALTLVLADMIFVNSVFANGGQYETYEGRKIYPVFKRMIEANPNYADNIEQFVHDVLYGSFKYCFFGDMSIWERLCGEPIDEKTNVLKDFRDKYDSYFTADMFWTATNFDNMAKSSEIYKNWWNAVQDWRTPDLELHSVDEFTNEFGLRRFELNKVGLLDEIFESVYQKYVKRVLVTKIDPIAPEKVLLHSHVRYVMGQSLIFFRFSHDSAIQNKFALIDDTMDDITENNIIVTNQSVETFRQFYNLCLEQLKQDGYITADDVISYKDVFPPFFVPNYLSGYESFSSNGRELKDFQREILHM